MRSEIISQIEENIAVKQQMLATLVADIDRCAGHIIQTLDNGGKIMLCGNGGSAADAQHIAAELVVRLRGTFNRPALPAIALTVDSSILTAAGNDFGFREIFSRQVEALGQAGDLLVAISTSGNSENILAAVETARDKSIFTVGFLGEDGGALKPVVDFPLVMPSSTTSRIQESHILVAHIICLLCEKQLYGDKP